MCHRQPSEQDMMMFSRVMLPRQSGSVLVVVLFVVVVMGLLAASMARLEWSNQDTQTRELLGTQAWFVAHSGNEWALTQLFPLNQGSSVSLLDQRCRDLNDHAVSAAASLIADLPCSMVSIQCFSADELNGNDPVSAGFNYYKLLSTAQCGGEGQFKVERAQEVLVKGIE